MGEGMKRSKLGLMMIAILFAIMGNATVWHVNSNPDVDFTPIQQAHDDAGVSNGDTLYVYGSVNNYGSLTMSKQLTLIGPGYFLNENPETQANSISANCNTFSLNSGSENSFITGLDIDYLIIKTSNQKIYRK